MSSCTTAWLSCKIAGCEPILPVGKMLYDNRGVNDVLGKMGWEGE
jgi:hypothetical protein